VGPLVGGCAAPERASADSRACACGALSGSRRHHCRWPGRAVGALLLSERALTPRRAREALSGGGQGKRPSKCVGCSSPERVSGRGLRKGGEGGEE
jgi:hypothetical protein